ncbi:hypothetical protein LguiB_036301 [Lonicera macranthoides]
MGLLRAINTGIIQGSNELEGFAEKTKKCLGSSILPAKSPEFSVEGLFRYL